MHFGYWNVDICFFRINWSKSIFVSSYSFVLSYFANLFNDHFLNELSIVQLKYERNLDHSERKNRKYGVLNA